MITILLQKILAALSALMTSFNTKLNQIKDNLSELIIVKTASGEIATFETSLAKPLISCNVEIKPKQASGTPTPSSPLPISGSSSVRLWQVSQYAQYFQGLLLGTYSFVDLSSLTWTTTSWGAYRTTPYNCKAVSSGSDTANVISVNYTTTTYNNQSYYKPNNSISVASNANLYVVADSSPSGYMIYELATPITPTITDAQFETLCQAFGISGDTHTISLGQTVYGGEVDVIGGSGTVTYCYKDLGDLEWTYNVSDQVFYAEISDIYNRTSGQVNDAKCEIYDQENTWLTNNLTNLHFMIRGDLKYLYIKDTNYNNSDTFASAVSGKKLIYRLATPTPITLANPIKLTAINGVNNVFGDTNGNTSVDYLAKFIETEEAEEVISSNTIIVSQEDI